jgi:predicted Fe-Mo cluster-binding NifX family protein
MKVGIATDGQYVSAHFGRCTCYTVFDLDEEGKTITNKVSLDTPEHQPGLLPRFLAEKGVNIVIAGGMGPKAQNLFAEMNIQPIIGINGTIDDVIESFRQGTLKGGESLCTHGTEGHAGCNH